MVYFFHAGVLFIIEGGEILAYYDPFWLFRRESTHFFAYFLQALIVRWYQNWQISGLLITWNMLFLRGSLNLNWLYVLRSPWMRRSHDSASIYKSGRGQICKITHPAEVVGNCENVSIHTCEISRAGRKKYFIYRSSRQEQWSGLLINRLDHESFQRGHI